MALTINTNVESLIAQRHLTNSAKKLDNTMQRLSSGKRINKAADDAAGLAITDSMRARIRSLNQGVRNAQDGISLVQIYEGGTSQISDMLVRMRELAMHSATDTIGEQERGMINNEVQQLLEEIERTSHTTNFNGIRLLDGQNVELEFQVGENNDPEVDRILFSPGVTDLTTDGLGVSGINIEIKEDAQGALEVIDEALFSINNVRAKVGSVQSRLEKAVASSQVFVENLEAAKARVLDTDMAKASADMVQDQIRIQAGTAVLAQANANPQAVLKLLG